MIPITDCKPTDDLFKPRPQKTSDKQPNLIILIPTSAGRERRYTLKREGVNASNFVQKVRRTTSTTPLKLTYYWENSEYVFNLRDADSIELFLGLSNWCSPARSSRQKSVTWSYREYMNRPEVTKRLKDDRRLLEKVCCCKKAGAAVLNCSVVACPLCEVYIWPRHGRGLIALLLHLKSHRNSSLATKILYL